MIFTCKIIKILPQRTGLSRKTARPWVMRSYHLMFSEPKKDGTQRSHYVKGSTFQSLDDDAIRSIKESTADVNVDIVFDLVASSSNDECYNNITFYFPKELVSDKPVVSKMDSLASGNGTITPSSQQPDLPF